MTHPLSYVHRLFISLVRVRINLLIRMPTLTLSMHDLTIIIFTLRVLKYYKSRMPGLQVMFEMRIRFLWLLFNRRSHFLFSH